MAVDADYDQLVHDLGEFIVDLHQLQNEVKEARLKEAEQREPPDSEEWVSLIQARCNLHVRMHLEALIHEARAIRRSREGERALPPDLPPPPDYPPEV